MRESFTFSTSELGLKAQIETAAAHRKMKPAALLNKLVRHYLPQFLEDFPAELTDIKPTKKLNKKSSDMAVTA